MLNFNIIAIKFQNNTPFTFEICCYEKIYKKIPANQVTEIYAKEIEIVHTETDLQCYFKISKDHFLPFSINTQFDDTLLFEFNEEKDEINISLKDRWHSVQRQITINKNLLAIEKIKDNEKQNKFDFFNSKYTKVALLSITCAIIGYKFCKYNQRNDNENNGNK